MTSINITWNHYRNLLLVFYLTLSAAVFCERTCLFAGENSSPQLVDLENVVVEVNGIKLIQDQIDREIKNPLESIRGTHLEERFDDFKQVLQNLAIENFIKRTLISQQFGRYNIFVSENEKERALNEIEAKVPKGMTLETMLDQSGMALEEYLENLTYSLKFEKLYESEIKIDYTPSDKEIEEYYMYNKSKFESPETVHARHILIKLDQKDDEKDKVRKRTKIEALRKQLIEGADFEKLAKEESECPSKNNGGDLGTFERGRLPNPLENAAFNQKVKEIGPVIQTEIGYHIVQVLGHKQAVQKSLEEVKDKIREDLISIHRQKLIKDYIEGLKKNAKIVYYTNDGKKK